MTSYDGVCNLCNIRAEMVKKVMTITALLEADSEYIDVEGRRKGSEESGCPPTGREGVCVGVCVGKT